MKIGFIGLGLLGLPIAENLLATGYELYVYNRTASKAAPLAEKGAKVCTAIAGLAEACDIVLSIVFDDAAVKEISGELLNHLSPPQVHVCLSTISTELARTLQHQHAEKGIYYISAPVFGRPEAAVARQLNYVVSGAAAVKEQVRTILENSGGTVWDFGEEIAAANLVKLCGNFLIIAAGEAIRECTAIARASGLPVEAMWEMFNQSLFKSPLYQSYSARILQAPPGAGAFVSNIPMKDLGLLADHANAIGEGVPMSFFLMEQLR